MKTKIFSLYTDLSFAIEKSYSALMPILRAHLDKRSLEERIKEHHARLSHFKLVQDIKDADWAVLPNTWNTYAQKGAISLAIEFGKITAGFGKYLLVWAGGDPEQIVPIPNAIQVQEGLHRNLNRRVAFAFERPGFVKDYVDIFCGGGWKAVEKSPRPVVGFCGLAKSRARTKVYFLIRNTLASLRYRFNLSKEIPSLYGFPVDLRARILRVLENDSRIETNFIIRDRYLAGIHHRRVEERLHAQSTEEFVMNIWTNLYTVCMRGGGNYSKRFYETLACGRIPILVSTDSMLPFEELIDWENFILKVDHQEIDRLGEIIENFHSRHTSEELIEMQLNCRKLWLERLSVQGYYSHFHEYLPVVGELPK